MGADSKIQWTHHTFNPWRGCTKVSDGCKNYYAEKGSGRNPAVLGVWGKSGTRPIAAEAYWRQLFAWDRAAAKAGEIHRVFCASLADVFEGRETMPEAAWEPVEAARARLFDAIDHCENLDFLLVTKRPENVRKMWPLMRPIYRSNVWLLTSVEDQAAAERRIPELFECNHLCPVLGLSCEPLLGELHLSRWMEWGAKGPPWLDWVIVGGESGPKARACLVEHVRSIVEQCRSTRTPCFVKQLGAFPLAGPLGSNLPLICDDSKGGDVSEWPEDLRVREFPTAERF